MSSKRNQPARQVPDRDTARFAYRGLDRVLHERARLGILTSLAAHPNGLTFSDLKEVCDLTDGNLSRHLALLLEHQMLETDKQAASRRPQSVYSLTSEGRRRFLDYVAELEQVIADAASATGAKYTRPAVQRPLSN